MKVPVAKNVTKKKFPKLVLLGLLFIGIFTTLALIVPVHNLAQAGDDDDSTGGTGGTGGKGGSGATGGSGGTGGVPEIPVSLIPTVLMSGAYFLQRRKDQAL